MKIPRYKVILYLPVLFITGLKIPANAQTRKPPELKVVYSGSKGAFPLAVNKEIATIYTDPLDADVVQIAAKALRKDIGEVTGISAPLSNASVQQLPEYVIIAGTLGHSSLIDSLVKNKKLSAEPLKGQWETFSISLVERPFKNVKQALVIAGSDRRGTAFGMFELSKMIGVHPFSWWADIRPSKKNQLYVTPGMHIVGPPSVKYRGIFLNDEDWGLQPWAANNIDKDVHDIGPRTYEKIFELLLRLKANYMWPAMHPCTKAFWYYKEDPVLADKYAIVLGASHCEPMLRNNVFEWAENFKHEYGATPGEWRYDLNKEQIHTYWSDRVKEAKNNEAVYTIGMRGIHDGRMPGPKAIPEKVKLLEEIITDQREMLATHLSAPGNKIPQIFCPYKEVLSLYRAGLKLPDDVTIVWADDNHGYIRQLSDPKEQKRTGGSGVYYHLSYWGAPRDYLWLSTISPTLISYEMTKAWNYGANVLWVFNVGDLKPAEMETQFAMDLAWDINQWPPEKAHLYAQHWAASVFGDAFSQAIANIKTEYYRLAATGKPEHMDAVAFTTAEADKRLLDYQAIAAQAQQLQTSIPARLQDAYYELVLYPVLGARFMNEKILYAQKSIQLAGHSDKSALLYAAKARAAYDSIQQLTNRYNIQTANGKWNGILSAHPRNQKVFEMPATATEEMINKHADRLPSDSTHTPVFIKYAFQYTDKKAPHGVQIKTINNLGAAAKSITVLPFTDLHPDNKGITKAPYVDYKFRFPTAGNKRINVKCLPTFPVYNGAALRYAIQVNNDDPEIVNIATNADSKPWGVNVLRGYAMGTTEHMVNAGETNVRIYMPDPGLVLSVIEVEEL